MAASKEGFPQPSSEGDTPEDNEPDKVDVGRTGGSMDSLDEGIDWLTPIRFSRHATYKSNTGI